MESDLKEDNPSEKEALRSEAAAVPPTQEEPSTIGAEAPQEPKAPAKKPGKGRKILLWIVAAAVVLAALTPTVILPEVQKAQAYSAAKQLLEQGAYLDAEAAFLALGDYRKAPEQACEARYRMAEEALRKGIYAQAVDTWQALGDYSDSAARAEAALDAWHGPDYEAAAALMAEGKYEAAAKRFQALDGYRDSEAQAQSCLEAQQAIDYEAADAAFGQEDYAAALKLYQKLGSYKDARGLAARTAYLWGCSLMENEQYKQAQSCFEQAGNYQNAADKVLEANYLYAGQLLDEGNYAEAINQYKACGSYQDAAGKILDSKYGYAENNLDQSNKTTLKYISELIAAGYPGAKDLEDALYAWKAEFLGFNNSPTKTDAQGRISKYYTMYAHFRVTGGRDGETTTVRARLVAPNGSRGTITFENCWSGGEYYVSFFYYDPAAGATGTITASIYSDKGVYLAGGSAEVVD